MYVSFRQRLKKNDPDLYKNFVRMSPDDFDYLLNLVTPSIEKANTNMRESICPGERLAITLRFLATGDSYASLMFLFKRSRSAICNIVPEVSTALYKVLKYEFLMVKPNLFHKKAYQIWYVLNQKNEHVVKLFIVINISKCDFDSYLHGINKIFKSFVQ